MAGKYSKIRRTPTFIAAFDGLRTYLRRSSPLAFYVLPSAMQTILDVIDSHPHAWPIKRKNLGGVERTFHLAVIDIAYRRLRVHYHVNPDGFSYLLAVWVDGHDEPNYSGIWGW